MVAAPREIRIATVRNSTRWRSRGNEDLKGRGKRLSTYDDGQRLVDELGSRFPILSRLNGRFGDDSPQETIPWFFALLMSIAVKGEPGACCVVLDKTQGTTALTAVFLALARLQESFPRLAERYARTALREGQLVRVKPSNFVYEYDGVWEEFEDHFRLKVQDKPEWRSFRMSEVLRLEPTTRKRPLGKLSSNLGIFVPPAALIGCSASRPMATTA